MLGALVLAALTANVHRTTIVYGVPPPDFALPVRSGIEHLRALRGKPVILNFWATWCPPCIDELKHFTRAKLRYGDRIVMMTVSSEPHDVAANYLRLSDLDLPLLEDLDGSISRAYAVPPIPVTVVVDPRGNVSYLSIGELNWEELEGAIDRALAVNP